MPSGWGGRNPQRASTGNIYLIKKETEVSLKLTIMLLMKKYKQLTLEQRPEEADGSRFGDFEMDTIIGPNHSEAILTITERKTNYIMIQKLPKGRDSEELANDVFKILLPFKDKLKTITTDNGSEFAAHELITERLGVPVYFTDPYCSRQKGAIENGNKLTGQYIPKKASFKDYSDEDIKKIQYKLNRRPREKLNFNLSKNEFYKQLV